MSRGSAIGCSLLAALGLAGCFYTDPINQRPAVDIRAASSDPIYRGSHVAFTAEAADPDSVVIFLTWRAYVCTDASVLETCDQAPFYTGVLDTAEFDVPILRADEAVPVQSLRLVLEAEDDYGATAKPSEELVLPVLNAPPALKLDKISRYAYLAGTPIQLFALVSDADDGPLFVQPLVWEVFGPAGASYELSELVVPQPSDPQQSQFGKELVVAAEGEWEIRVTARDHLGAESVQTLMIAVGPDEPPCLAQLTPIVPTGGLALPITEETLFRVPVVVDELDVYPPVGGDAVLGTTRFRWSLQGPGQSSHVELVGAVGNSVAIDPAAYTPGEVLDLRVEVFDRNNLAIPCPESEPSCASIATKPTCIQRQSWRVEVR